MRTLIPAIVIASLFALRADSAQAQDKCYMIVFGVQDSRNRPTEAHTFATFVRVKNKTDDDDEAEILDQATISWLPTSGIVDLRRAPERGTNHTLKTSIEDVKPTSSIAQWGPFEIRPELFDRAKRQAQFLSSGGILYKAVDLTTRGAGIATNCEHAVLDIGRNPGQPLIRTGLARGHWGSGLVAEHLRGWIIEPTVVHDWVNELLGLDQYRIVKRGL